MNGELKTEERPFQLTPPDDQRNWNVWDYETNRGLSARWHVCRFGLSQKEAQETAVKLQTDARYGEWWIALPEGEIPQGLP